MCGCPSAVIRVIRCLSTGQSTGSTLSYLRPTPELPTSSAFAEGAAMSSCSSMSNHIPRQCVHRSTVASGVRTFSMLAEHFGHFIDRSSEAALSF